MKPIRKRDPRKMLSLPTLNGGLDSVVLLPANYIRMKVSDGNAQCASSSTTIPIFYRTSTIKNQ